METCIDFYMKMCMTNVYEMYILGMKMASFRYEVHVLTPKLPYVEPWMLKISPQVPQGTLGDRSKRPQVLPKSAKGPPKGPPRTPQGPSKIVQKGGPKRPRATFRKTIDPKLRKPHYLLCF